MKSSHEFFFLVTLLIVGPEIAFAARPFVTDDARLTTAGSCQLESWTRRYPHAQESWALPACNPFGNFELTAGGGRAIAAGHRGSSDYVIQIKTLVRPLTENGWGWGVALGSVRHPEINPGPNLLGNTYAYLPASFSFDNDRIVVHANLGWLREKANGQHNVTWGLGTEWKLSGPWAAIAETYGDHRNEPYWQLGARYNIAPDRIQLDMTVGHQINGSSDARWISFGLRLTPESLF